MKQYFWIGLLIFGVTVLMMGAGTIISGRLFSGHNETTEIMGTVFLLVGMISSIIATINATDWSSKEPIEEKV